jgi:integrase
MHLLKRLVVLGADIFDPESIKKVLAEQPWTSNSKFQAVIAYDNFAEMAGIEWNPPNYHRVKSLPFVPTETEVNQLIAGVGKKLATFLQLLKETGARFSEALHLEWTDINFESQIVNITPKKGSNPRMLRLSSELISMLNKLPKNSTRIFGDITASGLKTNLWTSRKRVAHKLSNPRINKITFHSLRHWKATMEYHQTRDILHVKKVLGHRSIQNTMKYIDLEHAIFNSRNDDQFTVRVAETVDEACELVEAGFEYVTEVNHTQIFRKRQ